MKKKISVASAWVGSPPILILDEPTEGLDVFAVQRLSAQLKEMKAEGKTILIASHMIQFVTELTDRLVILRKGSLVKILEWSDLDSRERLAQVEKIYSPMDVAQVPPWKRSEKA
jgi:ABC-type Na+ transport system ATPase subunit NatA